MDKTEVPVKNRDIELLMGTGLRVYAGGRHSGRLSTNCESWFQCVCMISSETGGFCLLRHVMITAVLVLHS
jgi:hypothetical protein